MILPASCRPPWRHDLRRGFVAYPDDEEHPDHVATLAHSPRTGTWIWSVRYDGAAESGTVDGKQEVADAATAAWPKVIEKARLLAETAERDGERLAMIDAIADDPDPDISSFAVEAANYENLMATMDQIRNRARTPGILKLMRALSAQLYKLRTKAGK